MTNGWKRGFVGWEALGSPLSVHTLKTLLLVSQSNNAVYWRNCCPCPVGSRTHCIIKHKKKNLHKYADRKELPLICCDLFSFLSLQRHKLVFFNFKTRCSSLRFIKGLISRVVSSPNPDHHTVVRGRRDTSAPLLSLFCHSAHDNSINLWRHSAPGTLLTPSALKIYIQNNSPSFHQPSSSTSSCPQAVWLFPSALFCLG